MDIWLHDHPFFNHRFCSYFQVGDEILTIDGKNAEVMSHSEAVSTIRDCRDTVTLLIRRPVKPLVTGKFVYAHLLLYVIVKK